MSSSPAPDLSVVVAVAKGVAGARERWIGVCAGPQARVELLLVQAEPLDEGDPAPARRIVAERGATIPRLRALGLSEARGGIVAFSEAFLRPDPGWVDALLDARSRTQALAVGGPIARRVGSTADWALTLAEYGRFFRAEPEGVVDDLPLANVSYDRARFLRALGGPPAEIVEPAVHDRLRAAGEGFWRASRALVFDENGRRWLDALEAQMHHGRLFGGRRAAGRSLPVRLAFALASPLVPPLQLARILGATRGGAARTPPVRALPALLVMLGAWAIGEASGSLRGEGRSLDRWT